MKNITYFTIILFSSFVLFGCAIKEKPSNSANVVEKLDQNQSIEKRTSNEVIWNTQEIMAYCPRCKKPLEYRTPLCPYCKIVLIWKYPDFPNTPAGLVLKLKISTLYRDKQLFLECFSKFFQAQIELDLGTKFNSPPTPEERLAVTTDSIKSVELSENSGKIYFTDDRKRFLGIVLEDNVWKITLREQYDEMYKTIVKDMLQRLKTGIEKYFNKYHTYPKGDNSDVMKSLTNNFTDAEFFELTNKDFTKDGEIYDYWGNKIIYREKSQIKEKNPQLNYNRPYDLYSIGPNHIDEFGSGDDIIP